MARKKRPRKLSAIIRQNRERWKKKLLALNGAGVEEGEEEIKEHEELAPLNIEIIRPIGEDKNINKLEEGNRILNARHILESFRKLEDHECFKSRTGHLSFSHEIRRGFECDFVFICQSCDKKRVISSVPEKGVVNKSATWGTISTGKGYAAMKEVFTMIDVPCPSERTFIRNERELNEEWLYELKRSMLEAAEQEREIAIRKGNTDQDGYQTCIVIVDGGWSHRSHGHRYTANSGVACIIGFETNKLLYLGVKNKYCSVCAVYSYSSRTIPEHVCYKNWDKSSPAMESAIIVEGFLQSEGMYNLRYTTFIGDGDSNVMKVLQTKVPYGQQIQKVECTNHLVKNVHKRLYTLQPGIKKLLSNIRINEIIRTLKKYIKLNAEAQNPDEDTLIRDIKSIVPHAFNDHTGCEVERCEKAKQGTSQNDLDKMPSSLKARILHVVESIASHSHSLIRRLTTNKAENYMSLVAKFVGAKSTFYGRRSSYSTRAYGAALSYQMGASWSGQCWRRSFATEPTRRVQQLAAARIRKKSVIIQKRKRHFVVSKKPDTSYGLDCSKPDTPDEQVPDAL